MMRLDHILILTAALVTLTACSAGEDSKTAETSGDAAPATLADRPKLKSGLWTMAVEGMPGAAAGTSLCIDDTLQEQMSLLSGTDAADCTENSVTPRAGGGYAIRSVCPTGDGRLRVSEGTVTGDFDTAYRTELTVTTTGGASDSRNGSITMVSTYTYAGACPAGMKPGDFDVAGTRMNLMDLAAPAEAVRTP